MTDICGLNTIKANANVFIGDISVSTPDIIAINISKIRGNLTSTAQVQFHLAPGKSGGGAGDGIIVSILGQKAFTGMVKRIDVSPSFRCAGEKIVRIQAEDCMSKIMGRHYTRRQKHPGLGPIAFISSIYKRVTVGFDPPRNPQDLDGGQSPAEVFTHSLNFMDLNQFIHAGETNMAGSLHPVTKASDLPYQGGSTGGSGFILHDHSSLKPEPPVLPP